MSSHSLQVFFRSRTVYLVAVAALFGILAAELWLSVRQLSQTVDEGAHLYAGYQYWKARDYGLNPEHPPLLKLVAAAPLLNLPLHQPHPPPIGVKPEEYIGGGQLLYANDADRLLWRARVAASVFTFLLAALIFAAGYEMFGPVAALFALLLLVFEPTLLAHGALVTTDMAATCTIFAAVYMLYRYVKRRTLGRLLAVGLALGLAAAAKFSAVALLPIFAVCLVAERLVDRYARDRHEKTAVLSAEATAISIAPLWKRALGWASVVVLAWVVLWAFYGFTYQARPGSALLVPTLPVYAARLHHPWETHLILFLARWHILPEAFLYGQVDLQFSGAKLPSFLLGKVYPGATRLYFPIAFLIKSTLPVLVLLAVLPFLLLRKWVRFQRELIFLLVPILVYFGVSLFAPLNIGVRHILPIFPFVVLLAALTAFLLATRSRAGAYAACALLFFHAISSAMAFPNYIPYSNEAFGGPTRTYRLLTDSNTDWGQGQKEVSAYLEKNHVTDCWYGSFPGGPANNSAYYRIACRPLPSGFAHLVGYPLDVIPPTAHGTILISATEASGVFWGPPDLNPYGELVKRRPDAVIGNSILVFRGDVNLPLASAEGHSSAASMLMQQGKLVQALSEAQTAANLAPDAPDIQANLAMVLLKSGRPEEAQQAAQNARAAARKLDPQDLLKTNELLASLKQLEPTK